MTSSTRRFPSHSYSCCVARCLPSLSLHGREATLRFRPVCFPVANKLFSARPSLQSQQTPRAAADDAAATQMAPSDVKKTDDVVVGTVVTPSIFNKPWLRTTAVVGTLLAASQVLQRPLPGEMLKLTHFFVFAAWFGSSIWVLLLSPKIMFSTLGRQTFGKLQAKLFPQYFGFSVLSLVVLLGTRTFTEWPIVLLVALLGTCVNWLVLEPVISSNALKRYALENAETRDAEAIAALVKKTSKFHGMSSAVALVTLCCSIAYGFALVSAGAL